jgi:hypothetical protein
LGANVFPRQWPILQLTCANWPLRRFWEKKKHLPPSTECCKLRSNSKIRLHWWNWKSYTVARFGIFLFASIKRTQIPSKIYKEEKKDHW